MSNDIAEQGLCTGGSPEHGELRVSKASNSNNASTTSCTRCLKFQTGVNVRVACTWHDWARYSLKFQWHQKRGKPVRAQIARPQAPGPHDSVGVDWGPRICICNTFPSDAWCYWSRGHTLRTTDLKEETAECVNSDWRQKNPGWDYLNNNSWRDFWVKRKRLIMWRYCNR